jgi:hypothetical protein
VILSVGGGCAAGIAALLAVGALLFAVTTWPSYVLGLLSVPEAGADRVQRVVAWVSVALLAAATGGVAFLVIGGC